MVSIQIGDEADLRVKEGVEVVVHPQGISLTMDNLGLNMISEPGVKYAMVPTILHQLASRGTIT